MTCFFLKSGSEWPPRLEGRKGLKVKLRGLHGLAWSKGVVFFSQFFPEIQTCEGKKVHRGIGQSAGLCGRAEFTEDSCTEATPLFCLTPGQYSAVYPIPILYFLGLGIAIRWLLNTIRKLQSRAFFQRILLL